MSVAFDEYDLVASVSRESFFHFLQEFWQEVVDTELILNWHIKYLCDEYQKVVERVIAGQPKKYDLLINVSPGTTKSSIISILGPAWTFTRKPSFRHICISHTDKLVLDLSRRCRDVVRSSKYQQCFGVERKFKGKTIPPVAISDDQDTKGYWATDAGGFRLGGTVSGQSPTGFHGDCFPYEVRLTTDKGLLPIGQIVENRLPVQVLAYNHKEEKEAWRPITCYMSRLEDSLLQITTSDGRLIKCTKEHPIFVEGVGYVNAEFLIVGDELHVKKEADAGRKVVAASITQEVRIPRQVYNLEVAVDNNYFAEGILVHNCITIDDPINPEAVLSELALEQANRFMDRTLPTRKTNKLVSATIMIMQRLHQDDPAGHWLEQTKSTTKLKHICLPGTTEYKIKPSFLKDFYQDGLFDPIRMPREVLDDLYTKLGQWGYAGQIGQDPIPLGGGMFKIDRLNYGPLPTELKRATRYWDTAGSLTGAYTAGVKMGYDFKGRLWVLHVKRNRWAPEERDKTIKDTAISDGKRTSVGIEQQGGSSGKEVAQATVRMLAGYLAYVDRPTGDKAWRAQTFASQVNSGNVWMPEGAEWVQDYIDEMQFFPLSKYKDQIDASSGAMKKLTAKVMVGGLRGF